MRKLRLGDVDPAIDIDPLKPNAPIFMVANDKWELYPTIAQAAGLRIEKRFTRPVSNRTEKDKAAYFEEIFHMRENDESPAA